MEKYLYQVSDNIEKFDIIVDSNTIKSDRVKKAFSLFNHFVLICALSSELDIQLKSALRISNQYSFVINDINTYIQAGSDFLPLDLFLVLDESKQSVPIDPILNFIRQYDELCFNTKICVDEVIDSQFIWEVIWEIVRKNYHPNLISRFDSCFAFESLDDAKSFSKDYRNNESVYRVEVLDASLERYDMEWLTNVPTNSTFNDAVIYAQNYWNKLSSENPIFEILIDGTYKIHKNE